MLISWSRTKISLRLGLSKPTLLVCLLAASCSRSSDEGPQGETIACALDGAADFAQVCVLERDGPRFLIRRPDGGFRRFEPIEGRGIRSIDGADAAILVPLADGSTEIAIDGDRYRVRVAAPPEQEVR